MSRTTAITPVPRRQDVYIYAMSDDDRTKFPKMKSLPTSIPVTCRHRESEAKMTVAQAEVPVAQLQQASRSPPDR
ncbi:hypothetical protein NGTWS0302_24150 [Mycolicibacterium cyprinidarum]|uniref:Uncharacterized protein n=1 Tax=Mycolicibacterium cyprinidarum TaxID=2860311 RepID=A0ABQ4VBN5_9MYCO|nr:hypothetical protein NGTWS0302_24150 [Mycolicibacterium sp. NGTWS0302]GJF13469.1 hypothetical protein NGTWS1803_24900 [Mycolicibacterium sp. NGTWS1803]GJF17112.1 hypothetical protein NGTWS1702_23040 [Mycolicibacterium sp. NGTWSNA01]